MTYRMPSLDAKAPFDKFAILLDFGDLLLQGDAIASQEIVASPNDLQLDDITIVPSSTSGVANQALAAVISGGTVNSFYTVTAQIVTTAQEQFQRSFTVMPQNL